MSGFDFSLTSENIPRSSINTQDPICYINEILLYLDEVMVAKDGSVEGVTVRKYAYNSKLKIIRVNGRGHTKKSSPNVL